MKIHKFSWNVALDEYQQKCKSYCEHYGLFRRSVGLKHDFLYDERTVLSMVQKANFLCQKLQLYSYKL